MVDANLPVVCGDAKQQDKHGVVDVEAVSDERENLHGPHDLIITENDQ